MVQRALLSLLLVTCAAPPSAPLPSPPPSPSASSVVAPTSLAPAPDAAPAPSTYPALIDAPEIACTIPASEWIDGPIDLFAREGGAAIAGFAVAESLAVMIPKKGAAVVEATVDGWIVRALAPGAKVLRSDIGGGFESYFVVSPSLLFEPRGMMRVFEENDHVAAFALPRGFATEIKFPYECKDLRVGAKTLAEALPDPKSRYVYLRKGTTLNVAWAADRPAVQRVSVLEDSRSRVDEEKGTRVKLDWDGCDGRIIGWVEKSEVSTSYPTRREWPMYLGAACPDRPKPRAAVPPKGETVACPRPTRLLVRTDGNARSFGTIPPRARFVVTHRDGRFATVASPRGLLEARTGSVLAVDVSDLVDCAAP